MSNDFSSVNCHPSSYGPRFVVVAFGLGASLVASSTVVHAQITYVPVDFGPALTGGHVQVTNAVCHEEDGSVSDGELWTDGAFVQANKLPNNIVILPKGWTTASGVCQWWIGGTHYSNYDETRVINNLRASDAHPQMIGGYSFSTNWSPSQSLDSADAAKSTPFSIVRISEPGVHTVTFQPHTSGTSCRQPTEPPFAFTSTINAVECLPTWNLEGGGAATLPTDAPIDMDYPAELETAVRAAVAAWNSSVNAVGVQLNPDSNAGCMIPYAHRPHCIKIQIVSNCPIRPDACSCTTYSAHPDGVYTDTSTISVPHMYTSWPDATREDALEWYLAHEFGHILRLENAETCAPNTSVMNTPAVCGDSQSNKTPTPSDTLPVTKSIYGPGSKKTCGW